MFVQLNRATKSIHMCRCSKGIAVLPLIISMSTQCCVSKNAWFFTSFLANLHVSSFAFGTTVCRSLFFMCVISIIWKEQSCSTHVVCSDGDCQGQQNETCPNRRDFRGYNALFTPAEIENIEFTQFGYNLKKSSLGTLYWR